MGPQVKAIDKMDLEELLALKEDLGDSTPDSVLEAIEQKSGQPPESTPVAPVSSLSYQPSTHILGDDTPRDSQSTPTRKHSFFSTPAP